MALNFNPGYVPEKRDKKTGKIIRPYQAAPTSISFIAGDRRFEASLKLHKKSQPSIIAQIFPFCSSRTGDCDPLGKGGFGAVYKVRGPDENSYVKYYALKVINYARECSEREIDILYKLNGAGIFPRFYAAFEETSIFGNKTIYIFMELLEDPWVSLQKALFSENPAESIVGLPSDQQQNFLQSLGPAIIGVTKKLHATGNAHHDMKPDNIMINMGPDKKVIAALLVDAGSTASSSEEFTKSKCPGTRYFSLESAAKGFSYKDKLGEVSVVGPDPTAGDLLWAINRTFGERVTPARNMFSLSQMYKLIESFLKGKGINSKSLEANWEILYREPFAIRRYVVDTMQRPKVSNAEKASNSAPSSAKRRGIGGTRKLHYKRRKKTHRKKRSI
jgi:serine/threonine protein kinase